MDKLEKPQPNSAEQLVNSKSLNPTRRSKNYLMIGSNKTEWSKNYLVIASNKTEWSKNYLVIENIVLRN